MQTPAHNTADRIVFFDGECGICSLSIRMLLKIDFRNRLNFAPLQGETAKALVAPKLIDREDLSTIVYLNFDHDTYIKSNAIIMILRDIGWPYKIFEILKLFPEGFRDYFYEQIAERRFKLSRSLKCRLLTPSERARFLP